jgi:energy-coupling factor transporter transmembrane protein EcfT
MIIILSYNYIFILSKTVEDMYLAMKSRMVGRIDSETVRELVAGRIFFIFITSRLRYEETYKAMLGRGFSGEINLVNFRGFTKLDIAAGLIFATIGVALIIV